MSQEIKDAYSTLIKIASALEQLENIQNEVGKKHPGAQENANAKYEDVQERLIQPYEHMHDWYSRQGVNPKVVGADEHDEPMVHAADAAKGLNQRFFYPHSKEFKKNAGYVRKSTASRMKKAGL